MLALSAIQSLDRQLSSQLLTCHQLMEVLLDYSWVPPCLEKWVTLQARANRRLSISHFGERSLSFLIFILLLCCSSTLIEMVPAGSQNLSLFESHRGSQSEQTMYSWYYPKDNIILMTQIQFQQNQDSEHLELLP